MIKIDITHTNSTKPQKWKTKWQKIQHQKERKTSEWVHMKGLHENDAFQPNAHQIEACCCRFSRQEVGKMKIGKSLWILQKFISTFL